MVLQKKVILIILSIFFLSSCGNNNVDNKNFVSSELLVDINSSTMNTTFGYKAYKIVYKSHTPRGEIVEASGLLVLPTGYENMEGFSISMVCDARGTIFANSEAPTLNFMPQDNPIGAGFSATAGFATIQPDFLGFGKSSDKTHPYLLKDALAQNSIDMIEAVIEFAQENSIAINGQLFLSGYSEGGYATMATIQKIEESYSDTLSVVASAPMSGPYNLEMMTQSVLASDVLLYSPFIGFTVFAYANAYDNIELNSIINEPYASKFSSLFDGSKLGDEIYLNLTNYTEELFTQDIINNYQGSRFQEAIIENSISNWKPLNKMRLYNCDQDPIVPLIFAEDAYNNFINNGATDIELITLESNSHRECAEITYPKVIAWFDKLRKGE
ncbi:hypothetical protein MNB_SV-15-1587 [hydrothermal vent metagenome]|uniref:Lysophospholipase n=1 Tax=hydrothermal vent metagenome TaxID=652676 RepID=A0A1W1EK18_9ZZZZ